MSEHVNTLSTKNGGNTARMKSAATKQKPRREYRKSGYYSIKRALMRRGLRAIDGRSELARNLAKWRSDLIRDLGNDVSTQQSALIDLAVKSKLLLDSVDTWLLTQPSLVNARKRSVIPVVLQRQSLADGLARYLSMLGLERRVKTKTLEQILSEPEEEQP
jgi:hypothetical protein